MNARSRDRQARARAATAAAGAQGPAQTPRRADSRRNTVNLVLALTAFGVLFILGVFVLFVVAGDVGLAAASR